MSNTISGYTAKKIKATLNDELISISLFTFVCMANDLMRSMYDDRNKFYAKANARCNRRIRAYEKLLEKPKFFVEMVNSEESIESLVHRRVYTIPEGFEGTYDEYALDHFDVVGTLMKDNKKFYVETDLEKIESIRREQEFHKMDIGILSITGFVNNSALYKEYLENEDLKNGSIITRGHGLYD